MHVGVDLALLERVRLSGVHSTASGFPASQYIIHMQPQKSSRDHGTQTLELRLLTIRGAQRLTPNPRRRNDTDLNLSIGGFSARFWRLGTRLG